MVGREVMITSSAFGGVTERGQSSPLRCQSHQFVASDGQGTLDIHLDDHAHIVLELIEITEKVYASAA
jgi:acetoacetate decarboxylase